MPWEEHDLNPGALGLVLVITRIFGENFVPVTPLSCPSKYFMFLIKTSDKNMTMFHKSRNLGLTLKLCAPTPSRIFVKPTTIPGTNLGQFRRKGATIIPRLTFADDVVTDIQRHEGQPVM